MSEKMILMPESLTAENGAKAALIGEFHETFTHECPECEGGGLGPACRYAEGETHCELCNGTGEITERIPVEWTTIKEIYKRAVELLGQAQDSAIAEAVAAERERCVEICRQIAGKDLAHGMKSEAISGMMCAEAIRSAAK